VKLVDLNLLLYAINRDAPGHAAAKASLEDALGGDEPVGLPWSVLLGFLRISTQPRVLPRPLTAEQAIAVIDGWLDLPVVRVLEPGAEHWRILRRLLAETGTAGNLTTDAHLAALAIENGCDLCSTDRDLGRFPRVRWVNPLERA
jgi:toxin-antitoxin system PIN domain toxin